MGGSHNSTSGSVVSNSISRSSVDSSHVMREDFSFSPVSTGPSISEISGISFSNLATLAP